LLYIQMQSKRPPYSTQRSIPYEIYLARGRREGYADAMRGRWRAQQKEPDYINEESSQKMKRKDAFLRYMRLPVQTERKSERQQPP